MTLSPAVITSKVASDDLNRIKGTHSDLLKGMAIQADKVSQYRAQKATELQAQNTMKMQMDKEKQIANTEAQNTAMTFAQKQNELDIKRAALSME